MKWILPAALLAAACTTVPPGDGRAESLCATRTLGELIGRPATVELGAEALRRSRARRLRWIRPGDAVTMDYAPDRLNVRLEASNRVESFDCG